MSAKVPLRNPFLRIHKHSGITFVRRGKISREEVLWTRRKPPLSSSPFLWKESRVRVSINVISRSPHGLGMDSLRARFISIPREIVAGRGSVPLVPSRFFSYALSPRVPPGHPLPLSLRALRLTVNFSRFQFLSPRDESWSAPEREDLKIYSRILLLSQI